MSRRIEIEYLGSRLLAVRGAGSKGFCESAAMSGIGPAWSERRGAWLMHAAHAEAIEILATAAGCAVAIKGAPVRQTVGSQTVAPGAPARSELQEALW